MALQQRLVVRLCVLSLVDQLLSGGELPCQIEDLYLQLLLVVGHVFVGLGHRRLQLLYLFVFPIQHF